MGNRLNYWVRIKGGKNVTITADSLEDLSAKLENLGARRGEWHLVGWAREGLVKEKIDKST